jgi:uncharacterized membrane protein YfcA
VAGAFGSFLGASALWMPGARLKQMFDLLIVVLAAYRI